MPSFKSITLAAAVFVASVQADYFIEPSSVPLSTRKRWCQDEKMTCPAICLELDPKPAMVNDCDPETLTYGCVCGNGQKPNISEYSLTLPYHTCTEWGNQCVKKCGNDNVCASSCREENPCGALNPQKPNSTSTSSAGPSQTSSSPDEVFSGLKGGPADGGAASLPIEIGRVYGLAVVLGSLFAGFAML